ncbi:MAG: putative outer rane lipoprotein carrier protein LolA,putative [Pseudomonadota bacterium]|jgi:outer membrane lipoprotein-sorting protein
MTQRILSTAATAARLIVPLLAAPLVAIPLVATHARAAEAAALAAPDRAATLAAVESHLNGIRSLESEFIQINPAGEAMKGTLAILRPGRMRIDYAPPVENFVVADGSFVYVWDGELQQQSNAPIGSTLADFLLRETIRLSGDVTVTGVTRAAGVLEVALVQTDDPGLGELTLVFEEGMSGEVPLRLRKWRVLDGTGQMTEVALQNPRTGVELDRDRFFFRDPSRKRERD